MQGRISSVYALYNTKNIYKNYIHLKFIRKYVRHKIEVEFHHKIRRKL